MWLIMKIKLLVNHSAYISHLRSKAFNFWTIPKQVLTVFREHKEYRGLDNIQLGNIFSVLNTLCVSVNNGLSDSDDMIMLFHAVIELITSSLISMFHTVVIQI